MTLGRLIDKGMGFGTHRIFEECEGSRRSKIGKDHIFCSVCTIFSDKEFLLPTLQGMCSTYK